eukprot:3747939-Lingulodinium_polyedra.AAC.1
MANNVSTMFTDAAFPIIALNSPAGMDSGIWTQSGRMACNLNMFFGTRGSRPNARPFASAAASNTGSNLFHIPEHCDGVDVHHP